MKIYRILICFLLLTIIINNIDAQTLGCNDVLATNFNSEATQNDGSCVYAETFVTVNDSQELPVYLNETSGLIYWKNRIWTHNDDTDIKLYSINPASVTDIKSYSLTGTINKDWEEISQDFKNVYVGDFGNNSSGNRTDLKILRIDKNSLIMNAPQIDTISFRYSLQTNTSGSGSNNTDFDCEAFIVTGDSIYLFTKEWVSKQTSIYSLPKTPGNFVANFKGKYNVNGLITGATYNEAKKIIVLSGYSALLQPFLVLLYDFKDSDFLSGNKRKVLVNAPFHQVEGICSSSDLEYYISNEKISQAGMTIPQKLHSIELTGLLEKYVNSHPSIIPKISFRNVTIYPNPAKVTVNINTPKELVGKDYNIFDIFGREVLHGIIKSETSVLELKDITPGFYIFCLNGNIFKRLIVK